MSEFKTEKFIIRIIESVLVVTYIIFEELIWNIFAEPVLQYLKSLKILDAMEKTFLEMHRYLLLVVFIFILGLAEGLGVLSGISIINGYFFFGIAIYALKLPFAVFTFWLFDLTKDKLMRFSWLKKAYEVILDLIDIIINSSIHVYIRSKILSTRKKIKELVNKYLREGGFLASTKSHYTFYKLKFRKFL
jgi:hypothetical protein